jgi:CBS domain containing-hemolysin-like protein
LLAWQNCTPVITVVHFFERDTVTFVLDDDSIDELLKGFHDSKQHVAMVNTVDSSDTSVRFRW